MTLLFGDPEKDGEITKNVGLSVANQILYYIHSNASVFVLGGRGQKRIEFTTAYKKHGGN